MSRVFTALTGAAAILSAALTAGCGGSAGVQTQGQFSSALAADGASSDWNSLSARYIQEDEAVVGVANDQEHLYVMLRFRDAMYAEAIRMFGLTLWLDPSGGNDKHYVLKYRGGPRPDDAALPEELRQERRRFATADALGDTLSGERLTIMIRDHIEEKPIPVGGDEGPVAAAALEQGFFVYEFRVPLGESRVRHYGLGVTAGAEIGVGLLWGNRPRPDMLSEISRERVLGEDIMEPPATERGQGPGPGGGPQIRMREHEIRLKTLVAGATE